MSYFSNPNFMYLQDKGNYSNKEIDKFIIKAFQTGKKKVINGNKKYVVDKEIDRIRKYIKFREPNQKKIKKSQKNTIKFYKNFFPIVLIKKKKKTQKTVLLKRLAKKKNIFKKKTQKNFLRKRLVKKS